MNHQLAVVDMVFRLGIESDEMVLRLPFTRHHADVVTANQRIKTGYAGQRGFRSNQPELGIFAQSVFHIALHTGRDFDFAQVFAQRDILDGAHLDPLIADRRAPRDNPVGRLEVDGDSRPAVVIAGPDQPAGDQQGYYRQQPEWRDATFSFNSGFSR